MIEAMDQWTNFILYGPPGSGKTTMACKAPYPIALIDIDNKARCQVNIQKKIREGQVVVFPINDLIFSGDDLDFVLKEGKNSVQPNGYRSIVETFSRIVKKEKVKFRTIVFDSGTRMVQHLMQLIQAANNRNQMDQQLWGVFLQEMVNRLNRTLMVPVNIVFIFHERYTEDAGSGRLHIHPSVPGQMGSEIAGYFNEVYHLRTEIIQSKRVYKCLTAGDNKYVARTSGKLADNEPSHLSKIVVKLFPEEDVPTTDAAKK